MCQPGLPFPHGQSHAISSSSFWAFHKAKSRGSFFISPTAILAPASRFLYVLPGELAVVLEFSRGKIHVSVDLVGVSLVDKGADEIYYLRNVLRYLRMNIGFFHVESRRVLEILGDVLLAYLRSRHALLSGLVYYLIIHIGEILDEFHLISSVFEILPESIEYHERSRVSDMEIVVYRRPADVYPGLSFFYWLEFLFFSRKCIIYLHLSPPLSLPAPFPAYPQVHPSHPAAPAVPLLPAFSRRLNLHPSSTDCCPAVPCLESPHHI